MKTIRRRSSLHPVCRRMLWDHGEKCRKGRERRECCEYYGNLRLWRLRSRLWRFEGKFYFTEHSTHFHPKDWQAMKGRNNLSMENSQLVWEKFEFPRLSLLNNLVRLRRELDENLICIASFSFNYRFRRRNLRASNSELFTNHEENKIKLKKFFN